MTLKDGFYTDVQDAVHGWWNPERHSGWYAEADRCSIVNRLVGITAANLLVATSTSPENPKPHWET